MYYAVDPDPSAPRTQPTRPTTPPNAPVWDHTSYATKTQQVGITRAELYPACLDPNKIPSDQRAAGLAAKPVAAAMSNPNSWRSGQPLWITAA